MNVITIESSEGSLGKNKGTEYAPEKILKRINHETVQHINAQSDLNEVHQRIQELTKKFSGLIIGGDHSFSYSSIKTFMKEHPDAPLIIFDAHADCVHNFSPPTHEDYLRTLIEENIISPEQVTLIGTRAVDSIEEEFLKEHAIQHYPMKNIPKEQLKQQLSTIASPYYLSIDIDVLDPSVAPGTGYPEREGMQLEELQGYLQELPPPTITDLMEVNPKKDIQEKTITAAISIIKTIYPEA